MIDIAASPRAWVDESEVPGPAADLVAAGYLERWVVGDQAFLVLTPIVAHWLELKLAEGLFSEAPRWVPKVADERPIPCFRDRPFPDPWKGLGRTSPTKAEAKPFIDTLMGVPVLPYRRGGKA